MYQSIFKSPSVYTAYTIFSCYKETGLSLPEFLKITFGADETNTNHSSWSTIITLFLDNSPGGLSIYSVILLVVYDLPTWLHGSSI